MEKTSHRGMFTVEDKQDSCGSKFNYHINEPSVGFLVILDAVTKDAETWQLLTGLLGVRILFCNKFVSGSLVH